jgi:streptogramin lyase
VQLAPADIPIPVGIAPSPDGSFWFTLEASGTLGILRDGTVRKLPKGVDSVEPLGLAIDAGGRVSFAKTLSDSLGTIRDPRAMAASRA